MFTKSFMTDSAGPMLIQFTTWFPILDLNVWVHLQKIRIYWYFCGPSVSMCNILSREDCPSWFHKFVLISFIFKNNLSAHATLKGNIKDRFNKYIHTEWRSLRRWSLQISLKKAVGVYIFVSLSYQLCDGIFVSFSSNFPVQYILKQSTAF